MGVAYTQHMCSATDVPVFAVRRLASGYWEALAPVVRELSGRYGIRRLAGAPSVMGGEGALDVLKRSRVVRASGSAVLRVVSAR